MLLAIAAWIADSRAAGADDAAAFEEALRPRIEGALVTEIATAAGEPLYETAGLVRFYADRGNRPAWVVPGRVRPDLGETLLAAVRGSERHGLRPDAYHAGALVRALATDETADLDLLAQTDLLFTDAFLHLGHHLARGAVDPRALHPGYERSPDRVLESANALASALATGDIGGRLFGMAPPHPEYSALLRALERLREANAAGDPGAAAAADRVRVNLERWRWMPRDLGHRHLRVNTPAFTLNAWEGGEPVLAMRIVVGEPDWTTPLTHGSITHLVLNPAWQIPHSIATREMLPAARRNPNYFRQNGIQVLVDDGSEDAPRIADPRRIDWARVDRAQFPYRLRQAPGPHNPLGRIKFSFANDYGVYLHGTPSDSAFGRAARTLSHGCVRVEDEIALAQFALSSDPSWTRERLLELLRNAWEHRLALPTPVAVHLLYFTATADAGGNASFVADPYGWDPPLLAALDREATALPPSR